MSSRDQTSARSSREAGGARPRKADKDAAYSDCEYIDLKTLAQRLRLDRKTVKELLMAGGVHPIVLSSRSIRYRKTDVDDYLRAHHATHKPSAES